MTMLNFVRELTKSYVMFDQHKVYIPMLGRKQTIEALDALYVTAKMLGWKMRYFRTEGGQSFFVDFCTQPLAEEIARLFFFTFGETLTLDIKILGKKQATMNPFRFPSLVEQVRLALIEHSDKLSR